MKFDSLFSFNRAIAVRVSDTLVKTPVTTLSLTCGLLSAFAMARGSRTGLLLGALLLQLAFILDNCDGEIARRKNLKSQFGMWYDFVADLFVDWALWTGLCVGALAQSVTPLVVPVAVVACLGSAALFWVVVSRRLGGGSGKEPSATKNPFLSALHVLGHDGDPSLLIWIFALAGYPGWLLFAGCVYVNVLWIYTAFRR
jgi:phosphatidylglycerophosphate synthase